eukprot:8610813-Alexandrium_andersonii.AAC.1
MPCARAAGAASGRLQPGERLQWAGTGTRARDARASGPPLRTSSPCRRTFQLRAAGARTGRPQRKGAA